MSEWRIVPPAAASDEERAAVEHHGATIEAHSGRMRVITAREGATGDELVQLCRALEELVDGDLILVLPYGYKFETYERG